MRKRSCLGAAALLVLLTSGCGSLQGVFSDSAARMPGQDDVRPRARPGAPPRVAAPKPPEEARSVEDFDTTSEDERKDAARAAPDGGEIALGATVASLGDPARPGFWLETPLVTAPAIGRVEFEETGKSAQVDLIPIEGETTAGSRLSLPAMRLIGAPLTGLPTILVFRK